MQNKNSEQIIPQKDGNLYQNIKEIENINSESNNNNNNIPGTVKNETNNKINNEENTQQNSTIDTNNNPALQETLYEEYDSENSALSDSDISENDIDSITNRTTQNKNMEIEEFYKQNRQYFIMTEGGTPIFSRYGDEIKNCSISATYSAIITKFTAFNGGINNDQESLNYIKNEYSLTVFLKKGKLFFVAMSNKNDSISLLHRQLELLYHQLLSVITNDRMHALEEKPSTCAKLLTNSNYLFEQIIEYSSHSMVGILKSYQVLPIDNRNKLNEICSKLMTCASLRENESWVPLCMPGISADGFLQLYSNFLPPNQYGILYVTEKQEQTSFSSFKDLANKIYDEIKEKGFLPSIEKAIETKKNAEFIKEEIRNNTNEINVETLKEFIKRTFGAKNEINSISTVSKINPSYTSNDVIGKTSNISDAYKVYASATVKKTAHTSRIVSIGKIASQSSKNDPLLKMNYGVVHHRTFSQFFTVNLHSHDHLTKEEKYILKSYIKLYDYYCSFSKSLNNSDNFYHVEKDSKFSHGLYINDAIMILGTFNLFKPNDEIIEVLKDSVKLIKQYETNFFISLKHS